MNWFSIVNRDRKFSDKTNSHSHTLQVKTALSSSHRKRSARRRLLKRWCVDGRVSDIHSSLSLAQNKKTLALTHPMQRLCDSARPIDYATQCCVVEWPFVASALRRRTITNANSLVGGVLSYISIVCASVLYSVQCMLVRLCHVTRARARSLKRIS